jgi:ribosomal protein S18 acetylase RimI-like enzyme
VTIRELRPEEWRKGKHVRLRALADSPTAFLRTFAEEQAFDDEVWQDRAARRPERLSLVCEDEGELVGVAGGGLEGADGYLFSMWVAPSHRRQGLGLALVGRIVEWADSQGAARVTLEVNERHEPAVRLYERAGFRPTGGRRPLPTDPGHDAIEMTLELPQ